MNGSLSRDILPNVTAEIYSRGVDYANSNRVRLFEESGQKLIAHVRGSEIYKVELR